MRIAVDRRRVDPLRPSRVPAGAASDARPADPAAARPAGLLRRALPAVLRLAALALLLAFLFMPERFAPLFAPLTQNGAPAIYARTSLVDLTLGHLGLVFGATLAGGLVALALGILVTRPRGAAFLPLSRTLVQIGQTFPPVAVLALAVPAVGFGAEPTLIALFLYGLLPIFENTLAGLRDVPAAAIEAARGMGMTPRQRLLRVELPLALPVILAGLRLSVTINMGTATIGSTVAATSLGEVILAGLQSGNTAFILEGALVVATIAVLVHDALLILERRVGRRAAGAAA
ncbi:osmoprotectant transport system permease protein [Prosthecomicrobium pneumaticum]|uniref:Osmoprotectant transport system permease protein n=2 Tax=Prosthecomicrobium pneumaticum TaxID=81895 RepID=A0A7W9FNJ4_9HYPH|nr:osmoprotectant transport system permease protein [Prosthecomicrobium pneumaticum]